MQLKELMDIVPRLVTRIETLEIELQQTKTTYGNAVLTLVKRVKILEKALKRKTLERISHKKTKNQAKSDKTGHGMEKWADYANLGNFIYKRKKGEKENEKKKDVEGLFFQHPVLLPYFYPATLHQPLDKTFPLTPHGHNAKLAIQGHFRSKG
ncbi:hypothetical protein Tco_0216615 [Tanacetum coccineum]